MTAPRDGFDDPVLGRFEPHHEIAYTTTRTPRRAKPYRLIWEPRDPEVPTVAIEVAREYASWFETERRRIHAHVADALWSLWQRSWSSSKDRRDVRTTLRGFARRITLRSLTVSLEDDLAVYATYVDGDLFGGHRILQGLLDRDLMKPELQG
ncbi:MAG: hypothetical protein J0L92_12355 [Deltaproteobacteria bacterium]|nr:hypothetical protein [Deltaproteobacteria bacterium]